MMLFRVVDDPDGGGFGKNVAPARRFLFNAMVPKDESRLVLQGIPKMIYSDNGPVSISRMYADVKAGLDPDARGHMQKGSDDWIKDFATGGLARQMLLGIGSLAPRSHRRPNPAALFMNFRQPFNGKAIPRKGP
jgi:hypothetical protein